MKIHAFRLLPEEDIKSSIQNYLEEKKIVAAVVLSGLGSLKTASIRMAGAPKATILQGKFEILSLSGTLSVNGSHLHICISDEEGKTIGGHLSDGSAIRTTAEIVIGEIENMVFSREQDNATGYKELVVNSRK